MKVIKTAAMVVGAVALVASGVGAIGGVAALGAIGLGGVSLATISAVGTIAGLVGTVATAISPPKAAKGTVGGAQTDFKLDPNAGIPYLVGRTFAGGNIVHRETWGPDNQYQGFVVSYSGAGTLQSFESVLVDQTNYGRNGDAIGGTYNGWLWNRLALPGTPAAPVTSPVAGFPGLDNSFRMSGHATGVIVLKFDVKNGKKFSGGVPKNGVIAVGERVYDPRQDSTWPGGNGPCRARDEATYVGGAAALNPWCHALTWALGRYQNGKRVMGVGQSAQSIDIQTFVDAANVADANGWTIGGVVYSIDQKWNVLRQMAQAGGGQCLRLGARLAAVVNAPKVTLATVNETDLVGKGSVSTTQTYRDRLNGMIPQYRSEAHGWEMVPASVVRVASYVEVDGEEKTREWPLQLVQNLKQAGELVAYELVNRREFGPITLPVYIRFMGYKPGDCLNLNVESLGLVNQPAIVRKRQIDPTSGNVALAFVSETAAKHPFALGHTSVAPPIPNLTVPDESLVAAPQASDWSAFGGVLEKDGVTTPAIVLTGDVRNPQAEGFLVELRAAESAAWGTVGQYPAKTTRVDIVNVAAGATYYVGVSFVRRGVIGERVQLDALTVGPAIADGSLSLPDNGTIGGTIDPVTGETSGGTPVPEALAKLDRIVPIEESLEGFEGSISDLIQANIGTNEALQALDGVTTDQAAALRQLDRDAGKLDEAVLRLLSESARTRAVLRDAGIVVNPEDGTVRIYAIDQLTDRTSKAEITLDAQKALISQKASVDYVAEQIAMAVLDPEQAANLEPIIARVSAAETAIDGLNAKVELRATVTELTRVSGMVTGVSQVLDALAGTVSTKAEKTEVDAQGARLGSVEQTLSTIGDVSGISTTIRQARSAADDAGTATLAGLLAAERIGRAQVTAQAEIRQQLYTSITDGLRAEAVARTALSVTVGGLDARSVQQAFAQAEGDRVLSGRIDSLAITNGDQAAAIANLSKATLENGTGIAGVSTTIRQQLRDQDATAEALLASLIAGEADAQRKSAQIVQIQTDFTTTLVANEVSAAAARQTLLARLGNAEAALFQEQSVRAAADAVNASAITVLDAALNDPATGLPGVRATVASERQARIDGDAASGRAVDQVTARLDNVGGVTVEQAISSSVNRLGQIEGRYTVTVDANGNLSGFQLIGSTEGPAALNLINTDLKMGTGRVVFNNGTYMQVQGVAFGAARDLLEWFGPTMPIAQCTRANGKIWKAVNGDAYYGGSLIAGTLKNSQASSGLGRNEVCTLGPFQSNGGAVNYVASWNYTTTTSRIYAATDAGLTQFNNDAAVYNATGGQGGVSGAINYEQPVSTITLSRTLANGAVQQFPQRQFTTERRTFFGIRPSPGDSPGNSTTTTQIGGGITVNDPQLIAMDRTVTLTLARGFDGGGNVGQRLSIISTEE